MEKVIEGILVSAEKVERAQIVICDQSGLIKEVGQLGISRSRVDYYYGDDLLIFAGMGDVHIHAREDVSGQHNYKEDFLSVSQAALNGGVTAVCDMPNNPVPPIDESSYKAKLDKAIGKSKIPMILYAGIGPATMPLPFCVPYKAYMGPSIGELFFTDQAQLEESLVNYSDQYVSFHCEDPEILENSKKCSTHFSRRPRQAEIIATKFALHLIEKYNLKGKLCHYSVKEGLPLIKKAKERGLNVLTEVTPQHLYFSQEELEGPKDMLRLQMNPPIRKDDDRIALLKSLKKGEIDFLATDHAPHTLEEKMAGTSGLTGLDTYGPFVTWLIVTQGVDPKIVAKICCENPGKFMQPFIETYHRLRPDTLSWGDGLGSIKTGFCANLTVLNLKTPTVIKAENLKTKVAHSPFEGVTFPGKVEATFLFGVQST